MVDEKESPELQAALRLIQAAAKEVGLKLTVLQLL